MWGGKWQEKRGGVKLTPPLVADATERAPPVIQGMEINKQGWHVGSMLSPLETKRNGGAPWSHTLPPVEKKRMEVVIHLPQGTGGHAAPVQNEKKWGQRVELRHPPFETERNWGSM